MIPVNFYIKENNPEQRNLNVIGVNLPKYITSVYIDFLAN